MMKFGVRILNQRIFVTALATLAIGCVTRRDKSQSQLEMVGGKDISESQYPGVVEILAEFTDSDAETCTATLISPQVLLTAAHCVWHQSGQAGSTPQKTGRGGDYDPTGPLDDPFGDLRKKTNPFRDDMEEARKFPGARTVQVSLPASIAASSSCYMFPRGWGLESGGAGSRFDIALLFLEKPLSLPMMAFHSGAKTVGTPVTYVGYGWNHKMGLDSHVKREGKNFIADLHPEGVIFTYSPFGKSALEATEAMVRDGDSGGPLFIDGKIAGVASALLSGQTRDVCLDNKGQKIPCTKQQVDIGYHVDVGAPFVKKFIDDTLAAFSTKSINPAEPWTTCTPREKSKYIEKLRQTGG
jgi:hypothetical protein